MGGNHRDTLTTSSWCETHTFLLWEILLENTLTCKWDQRNRIPMSKPTSYGVRFTAKFESAIIYFAAFFICVKYCNIKARAQYGISNPNCELNVSLHPWQCVATEVCLFFLSLTGAWEKKKYRLKRVERQETYQHLQPELLPVRSGSLFKFFVTNLIWAAEHTVYIF